MSVRQCDGTDVGLIMYLMIDGQPADNPEFAVIGIPCDCGSRFDDDKHDLVWPHRYIPKVVDLPNLAEFF